MALIVENGSIVAGANGYASVQTVRDYWADRNVTLSQPDAEVAAAIILATQYIDSNFKFKGVVVDLGQPLEWPREGAYNARGAAVPSDEVPEQVVYATAEYAKRQLELADGLQPDVSDTGVLSSKRSKVDVIETEVEYQEGTGGYFGIRSYPAADKYLDGLTSGMTGGGFGRIGCC